MRIAVVGSGGVGGYFGGRLAVAGTDVSFVARGAHLQALKRGGLRIHSPLGDVHLPQVQATDDPAEIGAVDVVFFTVKLYDTESAAALLAPLVGPDTVVVPFQNGVQSVEVLTRTVGADHTAGGTAFVAAVIRHTANDRLTFGELNGERTPRLERLLEACDAAGFHARLSDRIESDIWTKFVWLTVFSAITTVTRLPIGALRDDPDVIALCQGGGLEAMAVARAKGIALPTAVLDDMPWLSGAVVRIGEETGVLTPIHRFVTTVLMPHVRGSAHSGAAASHHAR
jgi:2-dehydropantoate 2-reductase